MKVSQHAPGRFCWAELITTDGASAREFYGSLLGCNFLDIPMGPDDVYTMILKQRDAIGGLYHDSTGDKAKWNSYIRVENVDEKVGVILQHGGKLIEGPFDVGVAGRMALAEDPTGAPFHIWEPKGTAGYTVIDEPGSICWNELRTNDLDAAMKFYAAVFGYTYKVEETPFHYVEIHLDGVSSGGMMKIRPGMAGMPPHWYIYFAVANCAEALDVGVSKGGSISLEPREIQGIGYIAGLIDGQGAAIGIAGP